MKLNQSLTAAITAAALVTGAGFAYAQVSGTAAEPATPGNSTLQAQPDTSTTQTQSMPSTNSGSSVDSTTNAAPMPADSGTLEPRADRN